METEAIKLSERQKELVEKVGVLNEKYGFAPAVARIQALLIVADETALTFDQIRETLGLSKSATSNALNFLLQSNRLEYMTKTGDRRRYFRSMVHKWKDLFVEQTLGVKQLSDTLNEVLKERTGATTDFNAHLKELIDFLEFYRASVDDVFLKWKIGK